VSPALQATLHVPAPQRSSGAQAFPHDPQFASSVVRSRQVPSHSVVPVPQSRTQTPPTQAWSVPQRLLHRPQLAESFCRSRQPSPQLAIGGVQCSTHAPSRQAWLSAQAKPHRPQFWSSSCRLKQFPLQLVSPGSQVVKAVPVSAQPKAKPTSNTAAGVTTLVVRSTAHLPGLAPSGGCIPPLPPET
jgi:hypothetical protein